MADPTATLAETPTHEVLLTEAAAAKVASLLTQEGRDDLRLRVAVQPGGCSGLVYQLYFDERLLDGDAVRAFATGGGEMEEVEVAAASDGWMPRGVVRQRRSERMRPADSAVNPTATTMSTPTATHTATCADPTNRSIP